MKSLITGSLLCLSIISCKKEKTYLQFTTKQLDFVNYTNGQNLKFIDTTSTIQTIQQTQYRRKFHEQVGLYGKTGVLSEEYEVTYQSQSSSDLYLFINVAANIPFPSINFASYHAVAKLDSLNYSFASININGKVYNNVYALKTYKNGQFINSNDTATLYHNKQFGVIQLVFPNGKRIVRVD